ncbi:hypothetical protein D3C73_1105550 [compost metagenome]
MHPSGNDFVYISDEVVDVLILATCDLIAAADRSQNIRSFVEEIRLQGADDDVAS